MRNINELIGIIKGINFDGVINDREVERLRTWVNKNRNLAIDAKDISMIKTVDAVLEDHMITDDERELLLSKCETYKEASVSNAVLYELNGIIEGIICDGEVNAEEVYRLRDWMAENGDAVRSQEPTSRLCSIIDDVLEDNVVTEEEQEMLLHLLTSKIDDSKVKTKIEYLCKQVRAHKNIGLDLIDLLDNENAIELIHDEAEGQLDMALRSYTGSYVRKPEIVFVSLVLIAMLHYDAGNFYGTVRKTYADLYRRFPGQKIEGLIRTVLDKYRTDASEKESKSRIINIALTNSIVPAHYLKAFFEFVYDIYKLNFDYTLVDDLHEEFKFIYEGLRTSMLSDGDDVKINVTKKSYKLIKTTKQLITNKNSVDAVINLSIIVIKLIDKRIWNKEIHIYNPYLETGYKGWVETLKDDLSDSARKDASTTFRSRWQPRYFMMNNEVYLAPPLHRVKADYKHWEICAVVLNDGKEIYRNELPDVREIIGGYRVGITPFVIDNPIGKITYRLVAGDSVIYDSGEKLYRDFLVFNADGDEISNNTDYTGTAIFVYPGAQKNLSAYRSNAYYSIASQNVHVGDTCVVGDTVFNFSALFKPGIFGEDYPDHYLIDHMTGKEMPVFVKAKMLIFESDQLDATFEIVQDGVIRKLNDFSHKVTAREGVNKYIIDIPTQDIGIHSFVVYQIAKGKRTKILDYPYVIDRSLDTKVQKLDDETYAVTIMSSLTSITECEITASNFDPDGIEITYLKRKYHYSIPFDFEFYRLSGQGWKSLKDGLWIGDISQDSVVDIYGNNIDGVLIYSSIGRPIEDVPKLRQKRGVQQIPVGFLASFKGVYDFVFMTFTKEGKVERALFCDYKCNLNDNGTDITFDPAKKELEITPFYNGKGQVYVSIINTNNESVFRSGFVKSGEKVSVTTLDSFKEYTIQLFEKEKGLSLRADRLMREYKKKIYAWDDFIGKSFKIDEIEYLESRLGVEEVKNHKYTSMRMEFVKRLSLDTYVGKIYMDGHANLPQFQRINPLEIQIDGNVIDGKLDVSVTKDGMMLSVELSRFGLYPSSDDGINEKVSVYTIDMDGVKYV